MSFKVIPRGSWSPVSAIPPGVASIDKRAQCRLHAADLAKVEITDQATVLVDCELMRVALRRPRDGEQPFTVARDNTKSKRRSDRCRIGLGPAIEELRLKPEVVVGRYTLHQHEVLLVLELEEFEADEAGEADESES